MYKRCVKRVIDVVISLLILVILSPIFLIAIIAVKIESKGPAIFKQTRLGKDGKEFTFYKFRSMVVNAEHTGSGVYSEKGDSRVTKVGRILRATSIDELPQAVNILKGDMSLIGPRPPLTYAAEEYCSSKDEIDQVVEAGADIIMLPFFKTVEEVQSFLSFVNGRCKTMLLFETPEAVEKIDEILALDGIDELFIGLNDLSIGYKKGFMFELLADGTVEQICEKFKTTGLPYGFGGIASLGKGMLPSEKIIIEHYRLGSSCVILSRSFCNINHIDNIETVNSIFMEGVHDIREFESQCDRFASYFRKNRAEIADVIKQIQGSNT